VKVGGATKAPDYAFRLGGQRVFFVEAKKPSVALKDDPAPAYQLRRYAWSAKLALSILTDFEEFTVYDCRDRPAQSDTAATGRIFYCTYRDYPAQWDYLTGIFAPEAITKGAFDRFADPADAARHDRMVALVEQMLDLYRGLPAAKTPQATRLLQQQIDLTNKAIDALVYELYGLTEEEIAIAEGGS
jgi:hypothetical protein